MSETGILILLLIFPEIWGIKQLYGRQNRNQYLLMGFHIEEEDEVDMYLIDKPSKKVFQKLRLSAGEN